MKMKNKIILVLCAIVLALGCFIGGNYFAEKRNEYTLDSASIEASFSDIQELATIKEYDLNIAVFIINNSQLGIIRQWEETIYDIEKYQVDLINPDFVKLAEAYSIDSMKVESKEDLEFAIGRAFNSSHAFLVDVHVCQENIPLPKQK